MFKIRKTRNNVIRQKMNIKNSVLDYIRYKQLKIGNNAIRENMNIKNSVLDYIRYKQLDCYGQVRRMNEGRLHQRILEWWLLG